MSGLFSFGGTDFIWAGLELVIALALWMPIVTGVTYFIDFIFERQTGRWDKETAGSLLRERVHVNK